MKTIESETNTALEAQATPNTETQEPKASRVVVASFSIVFMAFAPWR